MNKILPIILVIVFLQTPIMANTLPDDVEELYLSSGRKVLQAKCVELEDCYTSIGSTCKTQGYVVHEVKKAMSDFNRPTAFNRIQFSCGSIKK